MMFDACISDVFAWCRLNRCSGNCGKEEGREGGREGGRAETSQLLFIYCRNHFKSM